jgi:hypothetical protein
VAADAIRDGSGTGFLRADRDAAARVAVLRLATFAVDAGRFGVARLGGALFFARVTRARLLEDRLAADRLTEDRPGAAFRLAVERTLVVFFFAARLATPASG